MSETSEATFPGFDSGDIRNLPATEVVTGTGTPQLTSPPASTSQAEAMSRQGSAVIPPRGDSPSDQTNLIRDLIREELRRGLGHRSRRSQREDSGSSSSSQEGSRSSRSRRHSRSPSSRHRRSPSRRLSPRHAPSRSSHGLGGSSCAPPLLSRHSLVVSPTPAVGRITPLATVSRAAPSPPPVFVTLVGPAPPPYTSLSGSLSHTPPRMLLQIIPSMTPPPLYASLSPLRVAISPSSAPRPVSQSTPRPPAPAVGGLAVPSPPPPVDRIPTSINRLSLAVGRLPGTPPRPEHRKSHAEVSLGRSGLSPGVSAAGESPRTHPRDNDVYPSR